MEPDRFLSARYPVPFESQRAPERYIAFRHPAYPPRLNILFQLPRVDPTGHAHSQRGVHHRTALLACQIIANNAFDGHLYEDKLGKYLVSTALDGVLEKDDYFFIINEDCKLL
jgi:hypothetical protein